jgi:hypothetical protein
VRRGKLVQQAQQARQEVMARQARQEQVVK